MNGDVVPALVAAGGGSALLGGMYLHERRQREAMRSSRQRLDVRFPAELGVAGAQAALGALSGLAATSELVAEVAASEDGITHALCIPEAQVPGARAALTGALGSVRLEPAEVLTGRATLALGLFVPRQTVLRVNEVEAGSRALLAGLGALSPGERVVVRWALQPGPAPALPHVESPTREHKARERVWRQKAGAPGFAASGLVLVAAPSVAKARVLIDLVAGVYRGRRGSAGALRTTIERGGRSLGAMPRVRRPSGWLNSAELLALLGWPIGDSHGVVVGAARELRVGREVPAQGRRLFVGRDARGERTVALSVEAARHHVAVLGPSGVGKSARLARGILDDIAAGHGGAVLDPKNDLVEAVLDRVPAEHAERIVVLDPAAAGQVPGLSVLSAGDPELRSDVVVGALKTIFASSWGIRSDVYMRMAVRTLSEVPGARLSDIGRLFFEDGYRRTALRRIHDPLLLASWRHYEALSLAEQAAHVQSPMAKVMALLSRPSVRGVLSSPDPKLDVATLLAERRFLLVPLSPGVLGEPASQLIGALVLYCLWSAIEGRASLPAERRSFVSVTVDELATVSALPFGFELLAERARGLGAGLTVAAQSVGRLPEGLRAALLGNVATLVTFRAGADDASRLARELPGLSAADLQALGRFEVAARLGTGIGSAVAVMTGRTEPLPPVTGQAARIRTLSAKRYGSPAESDITPRAVTGPEDGSLGRGRRAT